MIECSNIATHVVYTVLYAFVYIIPSFPMLILIPKINLYQLFQVFPNYKVLIQNLTLQPNSCIVSQQHRYKPSTLVCIYHISQSNILLHLENNCIYYICINYTCERFWIFQFYSL